MLCFSCRKVELEREVTETQAAQIQLDKTAEDFKALHAERQDLVGGVTHAPSRHQLSAPILARSER